MKIRILSAAIALVLSVSAGAQQPALLGGPRSGSFRFIVFGDNRRVPDGGARPMFLQLLARAAAERPAFAINTGDMIEGGTTELARLRDQWQGYRYAVRRLDAPVFHVPGNHDLFDSVSASMWRDLWGATYRTFDYGPARFILLDTESKPGMIDAEQFGWIERQLAEAGDRHVFVALHRPVFPLEPHVGSSLDAHPDDRDRLHDLLKRYRQNVKGVFQGHEHLFNAEVRDGVPYYITGGAGADLHVIPDLGGFHHYLVVDVTPTNVTVKVQRVNAQPAEAGPSRPSPAGIIESWEGESLSYAWDQSLVRRLTRARASDGAQGLQVWFDFAQYEWPLVGLPLTPARDLSARTIAVDVFVPDRLGGAVALQPVLYGRQRHQAPPVPLRAGWNTIEVAAAQTGMAPADARTVSKVEWILSDTGRARAGSIVFDHVRTNAPERLESWETAAMVGASNHPNPPQSTAERATHGKRGLQVSFDFSTAVRPLVYAVPSPPWDLRRASRLSIDVYVPSDVGSSLDLELSVIGSLTRHRAPVVALGPGWNQVSVELEGDWLSPATRAHVERIEWMLQSRQKNMTGWVVFDRFQGS